MGFDPVGNGDIHPVFEIDGQSSDATCGVCGSGGADADRLDSVAWIKLVDRSFYRLKHIFGIGRLGR